MPVYREKTIEEEVEDARKREEVNHVRSLRREAQVGGLKHGSRAVSKMRKGTIFTTKKKRDECDYEKF